MMKGIFVLGAASLFVSSTLLQAQVYRCDGPEGTVFSDMPCGESAEEVIIEDAIAEPVSDRSAANNSEPLRQTTENQNYQNFMVMLQTQKTQKLAEVDDELVSLRDSSNGSQFETLPEAEQRLLLGRISDLESQRESIVNEYEGLISEMQRRIDINQAVANNR